jgi:Tol biopolymer transport system component
VTIQRLLLAAAAIGAVVAFVAGMAYADDGPGHRGNGKLAFVRAGDIWVANADGSNPVKLTTHQAGDRSPRWSPDGTEIAFSSNRDGDFEIFVMNADGSDERQVTFNTGAHDRIPSWTADATQIVYDKNFSAIYVVNADGSGSERKVADGFVPGTSPRGDRVVFSDGGLVTMHLDGSGRRPITTGSGLAPDWSPRGNELVFTRSASETDRDVYLVHANGRGGLVRLTDTPHRFEFAPVWSPDGTKIAFVGCPPSGVAGDCHLYVIGRDGSGETQVVAGVSGGEGAVDWQPIPGRRERSSGTIVFQSNRAGGPPELYAMAEDGTNVRRLTFNSVTDRAPRFSPDGRRVVFASDRDGDFDIYVLDMATGAVTQLTNHSARDDLPVFTANGDTVVYQRELLCPCSLRAVNDDGSGDRALDTGPGNAAFPDMSSHGSKLAFASDRTGVWAIYTMRLDGRRLMQVTDPPAGSGDIRPRWSPEGGELVFVGGEPAGNNDVFLVRKDGTQLQQLTSGPRFEEHANFSPDGERVIFAVFAPDGGGRLYTIGRDGTGEHALPQLAAPLAETFDDGVVDSSLWTTTVDPGSSLAETGGRFEVSIAAGAVPGGPFNQVATHIGSKCSLLGDYDMQVDFELLEWPAGGGGLYASLSAFFANAGLSRSTNQWGDQFTAHSGGSASGVPTTSARGSLRLVRFGSTVHAYAREAAGEWIRVLSAPAASGNPVIGVGLSAPGAQLQHVAARVAFDNFRLASGVFACPSWWRDAGPDWAAPLEERREGDDHEG